MIPSKKEIDEFKAKFEEIYAAVVWQHPEMLRLKARVDDLLAENTRLVLENRELRSRDNLRTVKKSDILNLTFFNQMGTIDDNHE